MELASAALTPVLEKLGELAKSELTLVKRVGEDVASLQRELEVMHATLHELTKVPPERLDEGTKHWASNVRELSYDAEDAIEAYTLHVGEDDVRRGNQFRGFLDRTFRLFSKAKGLHQVEDRVREVKRRAKVLSKVKQRYRYTADLKQKDVDASSHEIYSRLKAIFNEAADLVGVDPVRDELIKHLSDPSEVDVKTVSIVGFGGLGKTTLAKAVYDKIKEEFDCRAFVSVSRNPDITRVFKRILFGLDKNKYKNINEAVRNEEQLIGELRGYLQSKRYLIVVDDLWDERTCQHIKLVFPKNTNSSRLIMTTRNRNVSEAFHTSEHDIIHEMENLSDNDSLRLFHSRIFHRGDPCPPELEQVSRDILKKCGGVPLIIITIASLLVRGNQVKPKAQWDRLLKSIGKGLKKDSWKVDDMYKILSLSYYDLPSEVKPCFLYLSIFPEDYDIRKDRLIWRWIAEGFIQQDASGYDNLFDIGESYFIELVNRSMVQPLEIDRATYCRVHDMVLDLIRSISSKENFVTVWDEDEQTTPSHNTKVSRWLSIQNNTATRKATTTNMSTLRSFTIFNPAMDSMPSLTQFKVLRVLDLQDYDLSRCGSHLNLRHIDKLSHLRYLALQWTDIRELPMEVGKLQFLQTLVIFSYAGREELPGSVTGLPNLMRLRLHPPRRPPKGLGNLTSLEELGDLRCDSAAIAKELGHLTRLRVLELFWEAADSGETLVQSLGNLRKLQSLELRFYNSKFQLGPELLQTLGALPSLRVFHLYMDGSIDEDNIVGRDPWGWMKVNADAFPCARWCSFDDFDTVPSMFPQGAMRLLQRLDFKIQACDFAGGGGRFGLDDLRMGHLPSLQKANVVLVDRDEDESDEDFDIMARDFAGRGGRFGLDDLRMGHLPSLQEVNVRLSVGRDDDEATVEQVEAALRQAAEDHPNRHALSIEIDYM